MGKTMEKECAEELTARVGSRLAFLYNNNKYDDVMELVDMLQDVCFYYGSKSFLKGARGK